MEIPRTQLTSDPGIAAHPNKNPSASKQHVVLASVRATKLSKMTAARTLTKRRRRIL
jgi:hypothetical protein